MGDFVSAISGSSKKAAKKQQQAIARANDLLGQTRDQNIGQLQPIANAGLSGLNQLQMYLGLPGTTGTSDSSNPLYGSLLKPFTGQDLQNTPGYQFGLGQGMQALDHQQAARGNFLSGAAIKEGQRFAQDYAGTKFQEGYNRDALDKSRINDFLTSVGNLGTSTTNNIINQRSGFNQAIGNNYIGAGNAQAAGIIGQSNAWGNAINQGINGAASLAMLASGNPMAMMGGLGGLSGATGASTSGGTTSSLPGFSNNMLNPNFASNYLGLM